MTAEAKFVFMAGCIYVPLAVGYICRRAGLVDAARSKGISRWVVLLLEPLIACFAAWHLDLSSLGQVLAVPVVGALVSLALLGAGFLLLPLVDGTPRHRGAFVLCAMISNIGMGMGGFIAYMLHGVPAQSLVVLYVAHFYPVVFVIGVALAGYYTTGAHTPLRKTLAGMVRNPIIIAPTAGLAVGLLLNVADVAHPDALGMANAVALPTGVCLYAFSIGLTLRLGRIGKYARELGILSVVKFVVGPAVGVAVVFALGQWGAYDGLLWRVALIEGAMPVGVFATVIANLYDLDRDLANSAWIVTTLATAAVIPLLGIVTGAW